MLEHMARGEEVLCTILKNGLEKVNIVGVGTKDGPGKLLFEVKSEGAKDTTVLRARLFVKVGAKPLPVEQARAYYEQIKWREPK